MAKALTAGWLLAVLAAAAAADQLYLVDGRAFIGSVTVEEDAVLIEMPYGAIRFPKDQVLRIEWKETPQEQLAKKLTEAPANDPNALFEVARWAADNGLKQQAHDLYNRVLQLNGDHRGARQELGQVKAGDRWVGFEAAMELARNKLQAGQYDELIKSLLPAMQQIAPAGEPAVAVEELLAQAQLRNGGFAEAAKTYSALAAKSKGAAACRYEAAAEVLSANGDGMYVLTEPYPPTAGLLQGDKPTLQPGPASLAKPLVLEASLRDRAKKEIDAGRLLLEAGRQLEASDAAAAQAKYTQALKAFDRADALAERISYSYRVEIARRRVAAIRKDADEAAKKFDTAMAGLGKQEMTAQAYREMVTQLIRQLDKVQEGLTAILEVAKPFDRDLVLEVKWAQADLAKIKGMRQELAGELDEKP